jgi:MFS-type transporter involved in bile tolerance (Atg22 family)
MTTAPDAAAQPRAHRFLHLYLSDLTVLRRPDAQVLLVSRFLSQAGLSTLTYGAMVHVARNGGSQLDVSLLSVSGSLAALAFGLRGGVIADSLQKRLALGLSYAAQSALCFVVATFFGIGLASLLLLIFAISILTQITSPTLKAAVTVVATAADFGTVTVVLGLPRAPDPASGRR